MIIHEEKLNKLKLMACEFMESLDKTRAAGFNAGQAMGIKLMFKWINELEYECNHEQCAIPEMVYKCIKCGKFYI
jgi:hypothetical protein